jgi:hypothetical protein
MRGLRHALLPMLDCSSKHRGLRRPLAARLRRRAAIFLLCRYMKPRRERRRSGLKVARVRVAGARPSPGHAVPRPAGRPLCVPSPGTPC